MRPVTTVPRPEIENTSSIGIRNGRSFDGRGADVGVERVVKLDDRLVAKLALLAVQSLDRGAADHRRVVAREAVLRQKLAHFHLDEVQKLGVVNRVALVQEHNDVGNADLAGQQMCSRV